MKLTINKKTRRGEGVLTVYPVYAKNKVDPINVRVSLDKLYEWYPFNTNFLYEFRNVNSNPTSANGKEVLYHKLILLSGKGNTTVDYYSPKTEDNQKKPINFMKVHTNTIHKKQEFHVPYVKRRNLYIMDRAVLMDIPTLEMWEDNTLSPYQKKTQVEKALERIGTTIQEMKMCMEERYLKFHPNPLHFNFRYSEDGKWDTEVYAYCNEKERKTLQELVEMLGMLHIMRKIANIEYFHEKVGV